MKKMYIGYCVMTLLCVSIYALVFAVSVLAPESDKTTAGRRARWVLNMIHQKDAEARFNLGLLYYQTEDAARNLTKALYWFTKAAEQGHAGAQYILGVCYYRGEGVPRDLARASRWLTNAMEQGCDGARFMLEQIQKESGP